MKCLFWHKYTIQHIGVTCVMFCPRCGKGYVLMEQYNKITGIPEGDYWKEVPQKKPAKTRK